MRSSRRKKGGDKEKEREGEIKRERGGRGAEFVHIAINSWGCPWEYLFQCWY